MLCFSPECCGVVQNAVVWSRMLWCGAECCAVVGVIGNTLMIVRWRGGAGTQPDRIHATPPPCSATLVCAFVSHIVLCTKRKNAQRRAEDTQRTHKGHTKDAQRTHKGREERERVHICVFVYVCVCSCQGVSRLVVVLVLILCIKLHHCLACSSSHRLMLAQMRVRTLMHVHMRPCKHAHTQ
jgi:hypothetical protein